ncbi:hypothetical protein P7C71_g4283, partial [Lecanoromycetidae sp. Uapishka_2]
MSTEERKRTDNHPKDDLMRNTRQAGHDANLPRTADSQAPSQAKDHWTHTAYNASASFVPLLTQEIILWLSPQPTDTILDLGCGDGVLTAKIAESCPNVVGVDASANLISAAQKSFGDNPISWHVVDCRYMEKGDMLVEGLYDKVFSNAALHWILKDEETRMSVLRGTYKTLRPGGSFVFEMGGAGNVADVHTALLAALVHQGVPIEKAREACPWFFPSEQLISNMLTKAGFVVERTKLEYRPTKLTLEEGGGLEGWVRLMGAQSLEVLPEEDQREAVIREICDVLKSVITREEDGSMWLGYVRLKVLARKP